MSLKSKSVLPKEDLEATKQRRVTTGSMRLVLTPRARAAASGRLAGVHPHAAVLVVDEEARVLSHQRHGSVAAHNQLMLPLCT